MSMAVVHVGFHKTGTKTLQNFFATHREWLAEKGVCYPPTLSGDLTGHHRLACWFGSRRTAWGPNDLFVAEREIFAEMSAARTQTAEGLQQTLSTSYPLCLLSSEIIGTFDAKELATFRSFVGHIDRIVLYIRNGIKFIYSCWATKVRWGHQGSFDGFLREAVNFHPATPLIGPLQFADLLIDTLGIDRLSVRSFDAALKHPRGLIGDFIEEELGLFDTSAHSANQILNASPSPIVTELLRALNISLGSATIPNFQVSLARLRKATAGAHGKQLLDDFAQKIAPIMRSATIGDLRPATIGVDGSIEVRTSRSVRLFGDWKFPLDESVFWAETDSLMQILGRFSIFEQLISSNGEFEKSFGPSNGLVDL
jgi:hypothetical protein